MAKYVSLVVVFLSLMIFNSCAEKGLSHPQTQALSQAVSESKAEKTNDNRPKDYGAYLAGRVAHLRQDFNSAADYYMISLQTDPENAELLERIYVILASQGRVSEAAKFAKQSQQKGDTNNFTHIIIAVDDAKAGRYPQALASLKKLGGNPVYTKFITPLLASWVYVGMGNQEKAIETISILNEDKGFKSLYHFHAGMIEDYFGNNKEAQKHYEVLINDEKTEMSFRTLQVISNFYIRTGQKEKAVALLERFNSELLFLDMIQNLAQKTANATQENTQAIIDSSDIGLSEALFSIAANMRQISSGTDIAHIFICLSIYSNPNYDLAQLMLADILESREMYQDAIDVYDEISSTSESYNTVQIKKAADYVLMEDYKAAEILLKTIIKKDPNSFQANLDLGDVMRLRGKYADAIEYYGKALSLMDPNNPQAWIIHYALGIAYEQNGDWEQAESSLKQALILSQNHYYVQNYLGYSWLKQGKNIEDAMSLIVDAYNQAPSDGHITDSLGWAFYKIGNYEEAVFYLEKASELEPANALISDHLGNAYWQNGRKAEAVFQWNHTLKMKDDSHEVDMKKVEEKIENGMEKEQPLPYDKETINELIKSISKEE